MTFLGIVLNLLPIMCDVDNIVNWPLNSKTNIETVSALEQTSAANMSFSLNTCHSVCVVDL